MFVILIVVIIVIILSFFFVIIIIYKFKAFCKEDPKRQLSQTSSQTSYRVCIQQQRPETYTIYI